MLLLHVQISFGALPKIIHVRLTRRRHRENISARRLVIHGAATDPAAPPRGRTRKTQKPNASKRGILRMGRNQNSRRRFLGQESAANLTQSHVSERIIFCFFGGISLQLHDSGNGFWKFGILKGICWWRPEKETEIGREIDQ